MAGVACGLQSDCLAARRALSSGALVPAVERPCARFDSSLAARSGHRAAWPSLLLAEVSTNTCGPVLQSKQSVKSAITVIDADSQSFIAIVFQTDADLQHWILHTQSGQHLPQLEIMSCVCKCAIDNITKDLHDTSIDTP